jgi:D-glycerate 3-kinase
MASAAWIAPFLAEQRLPESYRDTLERILYPLAIRIARRAAAQQDTLYVGLCGSQGSGKSTAAAALRQLLEHAGQKTVSLSIDDFYLGRDARKQLGAAIHPLLTTRGVPGTHDVPLAMDVLSDLSTATRTALPRFDKAVDDCQPHRDWPTIDGPVRVVILEGWCVGAVAQAESALVQPINELERLEDAQGIWRAYVNSRLAAGYRSLFTKLSMLILLQAPSFDVVLAWRREQEQKLRAQVAATGADASRVMSDADIGRFISHYERLTRHILDEMPARADCLVELDARRNMRLQRAP